MTRCAAFTLAAGLLLSAAPALADPAPAPGQQDVPAQAPPTRYQPQVVLQTKPLRVQVLDGVTVKDIEEGSVYRLYGIDACAPDQLATLGRQPWPCGVMAKAWMVNATLNQWLTCNVLRRENGVGYARCASSGYPDVALAMLKAGMALTVPPSPEVQPIRAYKEAEETARKAYRGIWASSFEMPWEYRGRHTSAAPSVTEALPENPAVRTPPLELGGDRSIQERPVPAQPSSP
ncbi:thermonuclease family protein (plasmid) [Methylobacterium radiotolerans]